MSKNDSVHGSWRQCRQYSNSVGHEWSRSVYSNEKYGVADASPFVSRVVEGYLRQCRIDYVKKASMGGSVNPRQKCPFANATGTMLDDSERIIAAIKNTFIVTVDDNLSDQQEQIGFWYCACCTTACIGCCCTKCLIPKQGGASLPKKCVTSFHTSFRRPWPNLSFATCTRTGEVAVLVGIRILKLSGVDNRTFDVCQIF